MVAPIVHIQDVREGERDSQVTAMPVVFTGYTIVPVVPEGIYRVVTRVHVWNADNVLHKFWLRIIVNDALIATPFNLPPLNIAAGIAEIMPNYLNAAKDFQVPLLPGDSMDGIYTTARSAADPLMLASWIDQT